MEGGWCIIITITFNTTGTVIVRRRAGDVVLSSCARDRKLVMMMMTTLRLHTQIRNRTCSYDSGLLRDETGSTSHLPLPNSNPPTPPPPPRSSLLEE